MNDETEFSHVLYHDDLSGREICEYSPCIQVISRGLGKYFEFSAPPIGCGPVTYQLNAPGTQYWRDCRFKAVVTPLTFDGSAPFGGFCGIFARYLNADNYVALVLDRHYQLKLVQRTAAGFRLLAAASLEFCLGQSLTLTLTLEGRKIIGTARPYAGATTIEGTFDGAPCGDSRDGGEFGFISGAKARFGPHTVECSKTEWERIEKVRTASRENPGFPVVSKLERKVPLKNLVSRGNLVLADINGDGKPEVLVGQSSKKVATAISLTRLTCLTALDLDGNILWQAGVPNPEATGEDIACEGRLPFEVHDLYGDGHPVVVCVFGYDIQVRDGKTGRILTSAGTPATLPVETDFKTLTSNFGWPWGDETLNMDVASISFCDTQGSGGKREILIKDDLRNLAVLDAEGEPVLHPIFRHRGNLGGEPWIGDLDGDGKDEILCGYSLLDHDGKVIASLPLGGYARSVAVREEKQPEGGVPKRTAYICAGNEGLIALDVDALIGGAYAGEIPNAARLRNTTPRRILLAKFRSDLAGEQLALVERNEQDDFSRLTLLDCDGALLWTVELSLVMDDDIRAVRWMKDGRLNLLTYNCFPKLLDGRGKTVAYPTHPFQSISPCDVARGYCADGRDAILAWNANELSIYVPAE